MGNHGSIPQRGGAGVTDTGFNPTTADLQFLNKAGFNRKVYKGTIDTWKNINNSVKTYKFQDDQRKKKFCVTIIQSAKNVSSLSKENVILLNDSQQCASDKPPIYYCQSSEGVYDIYMGESLPEDALCGADPCAQLRIDEGKKTWEMTDCRPLDDLPVFDDLYSPEPAEPQTEDLQRISGQMTYRQLESDRKCGTYVSLTFDTFDGMFENTPSLDNSVIVFSTHCTTKQDFDGTKGNTYYHGMYYKQDQIDSVQEVIIAETTSGNDVRMVLKIGQNENHIRIQYTKSSDGAAVVDVYACSNCKDAEYNKNTHAFTVTQQPQSGGGRRPAHRRTTSRHSPQRPSYRTARHSPRHAPRQSPRRYQK